MSDSLGTLPSSLLSAGVGLDTHAFRYRPDVTRVEDGSARNYSLEEISESVIWHAAISSLNDPFEVYAKSNRNELGELSEGEWFTLWIKCFAKNSPLCDHIQVLSTDFLHNLYSDNILKEKLFMLERFRAYDFFGDFIKDFRSIVAIASFTTKPDSRLMWGYYCQGMKGFCIIYNRNRLLKSRIRLDEVEYGSDGIEINSMDHAYSYRKVRDDELLIRIPKYKHKEWCHENELRSLCQLEGGDIGFGRALQLEDCCIDGVIVGSEVAPATKSKLEELSKKFNFVLFHAEANLEKFGVDISEYLK